MSFFETLIFRGFLVDQNEPVAEEYGERITEVIEGKVILHCDNIVMNLLPIFDKIGMTAIFVRLYISLRIPCIQNVGKIGITLMYATSCISWLNTMKPAVDERSDKITVILVDSGHTAIRWYFHRVNTCIQIQGGRVCHPGVWSSIPLIQKWKMWIHYF